MAGGAGESVHARSSYGPGYVQMRSARAILPNMTQTAAIAPARKPTVKRTVSMRSQASGTRARATNSARRLTSSRRHMPNPLYHLGERPGTVA